MSLSHKNICIRDMVSFGGKLICHSWFTEDEKILQSRYIISQQKTLWSNQTKCESMILRARTATIKIKEISEIAQVIDAIIVKHGQMYALFAMYTILNVSKCHTRHVKLYFLVNILWWSLCFSYFWSNISILTFEFFVWPWCHNFYFPMHCSVCFYPFSFCIEV